MTTSAKHLAWYKAFKSGKTMAMIARDAGVSRNVVAGAIHRHRVRAGLQDDLLSDYDASVRIGQGQLYFGRGPMERRRAF